MSDTTGGRVVYIFPRTWLGRLVAAVAVVVLFVLAVFFFAVFLAVFAAAATVFIVRILWIQRKIRRKGVEEFIEGEYTVENIEAKLVIENKKED